MPITIVNNPNMPATITGAVYPNHSLAPAYRPILVFQKDTATSTGVFPDKDMTGSQIADAYHIHQIQFAGVITRICVTFLNKQKVDPHVAWVFYWPHATASSTFYRMDRRNVDQAMGTKADELLRDFLDACPGIAGDKANTAIIDQLNREAQAAAQLALLEAAKTQQAVPQSASAKDRALFSAPSSTLGAERSDSDVDAILKNSAVTISAADLSMVRRALKLNHPKSEWNRLIRSYYDSLFPVTAGSSSSSSPAASASSSLAK